MIGVLALAILSVPLLASTSDAETEPTSLASVMHLSNTVAGLSTDIQIQGNPDSPVEVFVSKASGDKLALELITDSTGHGTASLAGYHTRTAGLYSVEARHTNVYEGYGPTNHFEVYPGQVSASHSEVSVDKKTNPVGENITLTASLADEYGNAISGHMLKIAVSDSAVAAYSPSVVTDENGEMTFYITSSKELVSKISVVDTSTNTTLTEQPKLAFLEDSQTALGGSDSDSDTYSYVILAAESGPVDSFRIEGISATVEAGTEQSITLTAIDQDGLTVTDYTGEIRFSSTDTSATLPSDYEFTADDQGDHVFSLSVKFVTPGTQTLTATDIDQTSVEGEAEFELVTEGEYGDDFETEDFEREGDFTLISPASGSYSSDTIEIQGEADYGYYAVIYIEEEEAGRVEVDFDNSFTFTLQDLEDGTYNLYADIVELDDTAEDMDDAEILEVMETSDVETIEIDTTAPEVISISTDPSEAVAPSQTVTITVLSEKDLAEASVLFQEEIYELTQTSTSGKYQTEIVIPEEEGEFTVDVILMDQLGNEVQWRDQLAITVDAAAEVTDTDADTSTDADADATDADVDTSTSNVEAVTGLLATGTREAVMLSWESAESANAIAYYRVYYGPSSDSLYAVSETYDSSTSWTIPALVGKQTYYFGIAAVDVEGNEGAVSSLSSAVTLSKSSTDADADVPTGSTAPEITDAQMPTETPDTGPASTGMILLSMLGAAGYGAVRRKE